MTGKPAAIGVLICGALLALGLGGCDSEPAADVATVQDSRAEKDSGSAAVPKKAEAHTELRDAILEPQDRARAVQEQVDAAAKEQQARIAEAEAD